MFVTGDYANTHGFVTRLVDSGTCFLRFLQILTCTYAAFLNCRVYRQVVGLFCLATPRSCLKYLSSLIYGPVSKLCRIFLLGCTIMLLLSLYSHILLKHQKTCMHSLYTRQ
eukprot:g25697.t1